VTGREPLASRLRALLGGLRGAFRAERLPPPPPPPPSGPVRAGPGFMAQLFSREPLALATSPAPTARRGVFSLLFAAEPLDQATVAPAPRRAGWLTLLLGRERLDP
jgi:hypothetical protein